MYLKFDSYGIRPYEEGDLERLVELANNPNVAANLRDLFPSPYTEGAGRAWLELVGRQDPLLCFAIVEGQQLVGGIGLEPGYDIYAHCAEVGYWLGEPYWGRGITTGAVKAITEFAFEQMGFSRVWAGVFDVNKASARVLEKAGFVYEGRMRQAIRKRGLYHDQLLYARIKQEPDT